MIYGSRRCLLFYYFIIAISPLIGSLHCTNTDIFPLSHEKLHDESADDLTTLVHPTVGISISFEMEIKFTLIYN